jgi:hypothetical protein
MQAGADSPSWGWLKTTPLDQISEAFADVKNRKAVKALIKLSS